MTATMPLAFSRAADHEIVGPVGAPVILALGGITANRHVVRNDRDASPGWWERIAGRGHAIDTTRYRVLSVDFRDGGRARDGRPASIVTTHDQAARIVAVLEELEIAQLHAVVGASYGGMVALALAERWPDIVARLVVISAAHAPHPMAVGLRAVQRRVVELGLETGRAADAMARRLPRLDAFHTLQTRFGHDAFLVEQPRLGRLLTATLVD